jgi:hypothetical protein
MTTELAELFAKPAAAMSQEDIAAIVKRMRELRAQFELGLKQPAAERPKRAPKAPADKGDVDLLKDLDLS